MKIYVAICCDRHDDVDVEVFRMPGDAIEYAKGFAGRDISEQEITSSMKDCGWIYLANYGTEDDHVRVEERKL